MRFVAELALFGDRSSHPSGRGGGEVGKSRILAADSHSYRLSRESGPEYAVGIFGLVREWVDSLCCCVLEAPCVRLTGV